jgi:NADH:ubiquinone oxidoreductase subunit F (NADH-binding)
VAIANGAESEPASGKDRSLLWLAPHLVLDGLQLAADAVAAGRAVLYLHRDPDLARHLAAALAHRAAAGCDRVATEVIQAPGRFLAGETSALVSAVSSGPARPRFAEPPVYERGAGGRPTLVHNCETLAHLALIGRFGPGWFRAAGLPGEPGSMLCTVHRADGAAHVTEVALGTARPSLLPGLSGPGLGDVQAVLAGGYHGTWLDPATGAGLALSRESLRGRRRAGRGRPGRTAGQPLRPGRDRAGGPLPGAGVGRAVRPVLQRPAADGGRPGRAGRAPAWS